MEKEAIEKETCHIVRIGKRKLAYSGCNSDEAIAACFKAADVYPLKRITYFVDGKISVTYWPSLNYWIKKGRDKSENAY
ncbi:hypothetical protein EPA93_43350 [Ktedonosporobacter rubrisoli]|uniref:Uncharacterized protein n=1 Tax=Ktedonosporobacter rubrisoli TaxID=2509675 RepID=A0A4P6K3G8_KTERU|nr:hypothetical protein [Ktedonosporobacter rubrisoli]QBD82453.1 hypothetical protein EPA93_43350 [Ktedonosporobacter rubrisoli]